MSAREFATVGDLAAATIDVLDERGWCTGEFEDPDGQVCLDAAINLAAYGVIDIDGTDADFHTPAIEAVAAEFARRGVVSTDGWGLALWNDRFDQTAEDVKLALKHAAESTEPCPDLTIEAGR